MSYQSQAEVDQIYAQWWAEVGSKSFQHLANDAYNAAQIHEYLNGQEYSIRALTGAAVALYQQQKLHLKTAETEAAERAQAEERQRQTQQSIRTVEEWLRQHCPSGLLDTNGEPWPSNADLIRTFIKRYWNGCVSFESLDAAVATLSNALVWFDKSSEAMEIRNRQVPERKLSRQAKLDAGLLPVNPNGPQSHVDDQAAMTPQEIARQTREAIFKKIGMPTEQQEWQNKAEALQVSGRRGVDWPKTDQLRCVYAKNTQTGQIDWKRTYEERYKMAEILERAKNR